MPFAAEVRRLIDRDKETQRKREQRAQKATERATAALAPNPDGYVVPPMPGGLSAIRKWVRQVHDAYSERRLGPLELAEVRRSASSVGELYKVGAALRAAQAQERMAGTLAKVQHGEFSVVLLARLQESIAGGRYRPLPGKVMPALPSTSEPTS